jgi:hypothetical protein
MPLARETPLLLRPDPTFAPDVTLAWLLAGVDSGRIPADPSPAPAQLARNRLALSLLEKDGTTGRTCTPLTAPVTRTLAKGDTLGIHRGAIAVMQVPLARQETPIVYGSTFPLSAAPDHVLTAVRPLTIHITPIPRRLGPPVSLC